MFLFVFEDFLFRAGHKVALTTFDKTGIFPLGSVHEQLVVLQQGQSVSHHVSRQGLPRRLIHAQVTNLTFETVQGLYKLGHRRKLQYEGHRVGPRALAFLDLEVDLDFLGLREAGQEALLSTRRPRSLPQFGREIDVLCVVLLDGHLRVFLLKVLPQFAVVVIDVAVAELALQGRLGDLVVDTDLAAVLRDRHVVVLMHVIPECDGFGVGDLADAAVISATSWE